MNIKKASKQLTAIMNELNEAFDLMEVGGIDGFEEAMTLSITEELLNLMRAKVYEAEVRVERMKEAHIYISGLSETDARLIAKDAQEYREDFEEQLEINS